MSEAAAASFERDLLAYPLSIDLLARVFRHVEECRQSPFNANSETLEDPMRQQVQVIWNRIMASAESIKTEDSTLLTLATLAQGGRETLRTARNFLLDLLDPTLAPQRIVFAGSLRSSRLGPITENIDGEVVVDANILEDGSLSLTAEILSPLDAAATSVCLGFELNRQWIRLASAPLIDGRFSLAVPRFADLVDLSSGPLPPDLFALRPSVWPSVCSTGSFVVQAGVIPFAEVISPPTVTVDQVSMTLRLLPESTEVRGAKELEVWFGTGGQVWQLVNRTPILVPSTGPIEILFSSPIGTIPGPSFTGILKLALKS
jgi:hypothetical protein